MLPALAPLAMLKSHWAGRKPSWMALQAGRPSHPMGEMGASCSGNALARNEGSWPVFELSQATRSPDGAATAAVALAVARHPRPIRGP